MANLIYWALFTYYVVHTCHSYSLTTKLLDSPCGDWIPFKNEQCVKLFELAGLQSKEDAEIACRSFGKEHHGEEVSHLVSIRTKEKQKFLEKYLIDELKTEKPIWLGLDLDNNGVHEWRGGKNLTFSNWAEPIIADDASPTHERKCVEMNFGKQKGITQTGKWIQTNCMERKAVVCEKMQPLTLAALLELTENLKLDIQKNKEAFEQQLIAMRGNIEKQISDYKSEAEETLWQMTRGVEEGAGSVRRDATMEASQGCSSELNEFRYKSNAKFGQIKVKMQDCGCGL